MLNFHKINLKLDDKKIEYMGTFKGTVFVADLII